MKVILLDDDIIALDYLEHQLMQIPEIEIVGKFSDPDLGKKEILNQSIDLAFLDIQLPKIDGIQLAEEILQVKPDLKIVFVTGYESYAVRAFELNALDYLLKPVKLERLMNTIQRIDRSHTEFDLDRLAQKNQSLQIKMLGHFQMILKEKQLPPLRWRTTRAQELFLYMLQCRGQFIRKSTLIELLWPEYEPNRAYSLLYTIIYHIRKTLEQFEDYFSLTNSVDGYVLNLNNVLLDVEEWENFMMSSLPLKNTTIADYVNMMKLFKDDYLKEYDYWWAESERQRLKMLWLRTSFRMAEWYMSNHQQSKAVEKYLEICHQHPIAEEAHFALMKIFASNKNSLAVHRQYRLLVAILLEEFNEQPSTYITDWYDNWKIEHEN
ncbi:response regulator [Paenibacillus lentus]|uniref:Response regulator n=1 Tax=Paenibacillus lentus TaxID=1338368 RepID=A0A3Q8S528_9BACL|nr:response regulator [Paenibacillus lentus]AZK46941.1 response regulator [Paenibacillus lentus]